MTQPELFEAVKNHMGWDDEKTRAWFDMKNPLIGNITPAEFYNLRPKKCEQFIMRLIEENETE